MIPGDISSAAFWMIAASIVPESDILVKNVGLNPTRTGILNVMKEMGCNFKILDKKKINLKEKHQKSKMKAKKNKNRFKQLWFSSRAALIFLSLLAVPAKANRVPNVTRMEPAY